MFPCYTVQVLSGFETMLQDITTEVLQQKGVFFFFLLLLLYAMHGVIKCRVVLLLWFVVFPPLSISKQESSLSFFECTFSFDAMFKSFNNLSD